MPRKVENNEEYLELQAKAFQLAQELIFPDKRDLREALGCSYNMYRNWEMGNSVLLSTNLLNLRKSNPALVPFVDQFIRHLWGIGG